MRAGAKNHGIELPLPAIQIGTVEEYELATARAAKLTDARAGTDEALELRSLMEAIAKWDRQRDDATDWD